MLHYVRIEEERGEFRLRALPSHEEDGLSFDHLDHSIGKLELVRHSRQEGDARVVVGVGVDGFDAEVFPKEGHCGMFLVIAAGLLCCGRSHDPFGRCLNEGNCNENVTELCVSFIDEQFELQMIRLNAMLQIICTDKVLR